MTNQQNAMLAGFGEQIQKILADWHNVSELMVNPDGKIWIESGGKVINITEMVDPDISIMTEDGRNGILRQLAGGTEQFIESEKALSLRLPWAGGGRFCGLMEPITAGPCFCVRFQTALRLEIEDIPVSLQARTQRTGRKELEITNGELVHDELREAIESHKNIIIAGGTGSGKTTLINAMLEHDSLMSERLITAEDNPELVVRSPNKIQMLCTEKFTLRSAIFWSLRLRPDRIIVGEIRDGSTANDFLKAALTGHPGCMATIHAESAHDVENRLLSLLQEIMENPSADMIRRTIDVVVFMKRTKEGRVIQEMIKYV